MSTSILWLSTQVLITLGIVGIFAIPVVLACAVYFLAFAFVPKSTIRKICSVVYIILALMAIIVLSLHLYNAPNFQGLYNSYTTFDQYKASEAKPIPSIIQQGNELRRYKLLAMNPPKHFYVTLQDVNTGVISPSVYVSKHCNNYKTNVIGDEYNISVKWYVMSDAPQVVKYSFTNLSGVFC